MIGINRPPRPSIFLPAAVPHQMSDEQDLLNWVPRLRRYARVLRRDADEADDLVQDTLERAWSRAGLWQGVTDMRSWLFSIMHNLHVDALRRGRLTTVPIDDDEGAPEPTSPSHAGSPFGLLVVRDLQSGLDALPPEQREVVLLVALEGMSYAEVALLQGVPIGTVMSRLSRGRERLRQHMEGSRMAASTPGARN